jgi:hypothetical protein
MKLDNDQLQARIYHGLKSLFTPGDTLPPPYLEFAICKSFGLNHVGDSNFYADGHLGSEQASVKTRMLNPTILKTGPGRDFSTHPEEFLGPSLNKKQNRWTGGIEIVQRRQQLDFENDSTEDAKKVGESTLAKFMENILESHAKFSTKKSVEIVGVHGYDRTSRSYIVGLFWQEYKPLDPANIVWKREGNGVSGYKTINEQLHKVCERINGNAKREATCFKEFKNLIKYQHSAHIKVPIPEPWNFDQTAILCEINDRRKTQNDIILFE